MTQPRDLLALTALLVDQPSVSLDEGPITDWLEAELRAVPGLAVDRIGDNLVARTELGRASRLLVAGHTDTVPVNGNAESRIEGDTLWGLGAADMKSGLAVMLELARTVAEPAIDLTYVFYAAEEISGQHNGLGHLLRDRPDLLQADAAILGEPTGAVVEAGCQGTLRVDVVVHGVRAHTARPWMGRNAIHRLGRVLAVLDAHEARQPLIDGCQYREAVQAVFVEGGVAGNVVPDRATLTVNHRFAPDCTSADAEAYLRALIEPMLEPEDTIEVVDAVDGTPPGLDHPLLAALVKRSGLEVRAKLGWTDVARFAWAGIPAANFGPGDPLVAHTADEQRVDRAAIDATFAALRDLIERGPSEDLGTA